MDSGENDSDPIPLYPAESYLSQYNGNGDTTGTELGSQPGPSRTIVAPQIKFLVTQEEERDQPNTLRQEQVYLGGEYRLDQSGTLGSRGASRPFPIGIKNCNGDYEAVNGLRHRGQYSVVTLSLVIQLHILTFPLPPSHQGRPHETPIGVVYPWRYTTMVVKGLYAGIPEMTIHVLILERMSPFRDVDLFLGRLFWEKRKRQLESMVVRDSGAGNHNELVRMGKMPAVAGSDIPMGGSLGSTNAAHTGAGTSRCNYPTPSHMSASASQLATPNFTNYSYWTPQSSVPTPSSHMAFDTLSCHSKVPSDPVAPLRGSGDAGPSNATFLHPTPNDPARLSAFNMTGAYASSYAQPASSHSSRIDSNGWMS